VLAARANARSEHDKASAPRHEIPIVILLSSVPNFAWLLALRMRNPSASKNEDGKNPLQFYDSFQSFS
jgi:hypothetical protein